MRAAFLGVLGLLATAGGCRPKTYANFGDARLKDVVEKALENNPGIRRAFGEGDYEAALQWIPQLHFLPEPMVGVTQYGRSPETRVGPRKTMLRGGGRRNWAKKVGGSNRPVRPAPENQANLRTIPMASLLQARAYQEVCLDAELTLRMETHQEGSNLE